MVIWRYLCCWDFWASVQGLLVDTLVNFRVFVILLKLYRILYVYMIFLVVRRRAIDFHMIPESLRITAVQDKKSLQKPPNTGIFFYFCDLCLWVYHASKLYRYNFWHLFNNYYFACMLTKTFVFKGSGAGPSQSLS